jgi:hypothetical protein
MGLKSFVAKIWAKRRAEYYAEVAEKPLEMQEKVFTSLISIGKNTAFGIAHNFSSIKNYEDFQKQVPVRDYEQLKPYFDRIIRGDSNVTWIGKPLYLAKTSGTTSGEKFIPISKESIPYHIAGARDTLLMHIHETGNANFLSGKMMFLSGSPQIETNQFGMKVGRLSGIVNHFVPAYLQGNRVPSYDTNCIYDWEKKISAIVNEVKNKDLRLISGIPPWVQMFFEEAKRQTGKEPLELWKNLELFVQGGVDFSPYKPIFDNYLGEQVKTLELFPASEGFFAFQNELNDPSLLLLPDNGIFYEFIPIEEYGNPNAKRLTLGEVELNKQYALIISTNAGLWGYDIGDTVKFTSLSPYKIKVTGRVKHFISAFGEHVIVEEVNKAMIVAAQATNAEIQEFTVAPFVTAEKGASYHEWFVEFLRKPADESKFKQILDEELCKQNIYYKDLRKGNMLLSAKVNVLQLGASREYMKTIGKLGGQNKFPRLSNNRKLADGLQSFIEKAL